MDSDEGAPSPRRASADVLARPPVEVAVLHGQLTHGGSERQLHLALAQARASGVRPHVVIAGELGVWEQPIRALGVPITLLTGSPPKKLASFRRLCSQLGSAVMLSWGSYTNVYALALKGTGIRTVGSFRNAAMSDLPARGRPLWAWAAKAGLDSMICNSEETQAGLEAAARTGPKSGAGPSIRYLPNAVETIGDQARHRAHWRAELDVADDEILIVGIGRLAEQKNFGRFIAAFQEVHLRQATNPMLQVRAVIAGPDGGLLDQLQLQIDQTGLPEGTIRLIGPVGDGRELLCAADLFVLSSNYEGMPNVVLEAMSTGTAVVTTKVNGLSGCLDDGVEGVVTDHSAASLADAICELVDDSSRRAVLGSNGAARIERDFDPSSVYAEMWRHCLAGVNA